MTCTTYGTALTDIGRDLVVTEFVRDADDMIAGARQDRQTLVTVKKEISSAPIKLGNFRANVLVLQDDVALEPVLP